MDSKEKLTAEINSDKLETRIESGQRSEILQDVEARTHVPEQVKTWLQKIEEDPATQKTVNDAAGVPMLQPSTPKDPRVTLPTTKIKFVAGFKKKVDDAGRWLSEFLLRMIKLKGGKVKFKEE